MGSNIAIHHFVVSFVTLRRTRPEIFQQLDIRVFIIPEGRNDLGTFLARRDKWFKRYVFAPFTSALPICPQYPINQDIQHLCEESPMHMSLPSALLQRLVQNYVRLASQVTPVCVFDCCCWTTSDLVEEDGGDTTMLNTNAEPECIIPFVTTVFFFIHPF